jgi:uncharacterized protein YecE (DUF72 family)
MLYFGCASWQLPKVVRDRFPDDGTLLARYGRRLPAVEVNSSFYRQHRQSQYAKWASEVPEGFRFAVKMPRWLTHNQRLRSHEGLDEFLDEVAGLGGKLGPLLIQLPPKLDFEPQAVEAFFDALRQRFDGDVALEPRNAGWFEAEPEEVLKRYRIARVAADPAPVEGAESPGGYTGLAYHRLHGSPRKFYDAYGTQFVAELAERLQAATEPAEAWCIFNNTANESGFEDALAFAEARGPGCGGGW